MAPFEVTRMSSKLVFLGITSTFRRNVSKLLKLFIRAEHFNSIINDVIKTVVKHDVMGKEEGWGQTYPPLRVKSDSKIKEMFLSKIVAKKKTTIILQ